MKTLIIGALVAGCAAGAAMADGAWPDRKTGIFGSKTNEDYIADFLEAYPQGRVYSGEIRLGDRMVPLPEGSWTVVGRAASLTTYANSGDESGSSARLMLVRVGGGTVEQWLRLSADLHKNMTNSWHGKNSLCSAKQDEWTYQLKAENTYEDSMNCWRSFFVNAALRADDPDEYRQGVEFMASQKWTVPSNGLQVSAVLSNRAYQIWFAHVQNADAIGAGLGARMNWRYYQLTDAQKAAFQKHTEAAAAWRAKVMVVWGR